MSEHQVPEDSRHIHEERWIPGVPGVIAPPDPDPPPKRHKTKTTPSEGAPVAPSVVEEG